MSVRGESIRWVLAFDSGCSQCQALSRSVFGAGDGKLEILPLSSAQVQGWLAEARPGATVRRAPTLLRLDGASVRLWQGPALGVRLALRLGPRSTIRVLRALGAAKGRPGPWLATAGFERATSRRRFLELGAGGLVAAGILITGALPASADPVATWLKENRDHLPRTFPEIAAVPMAYRRAVYSELTPVERSAAWVAQLEYHRATAPPVNDYQTDVFDDALAIASAPGNFTDDHVAPSSTGVLAGRSIAAFGMSQARDIFATLGPAETPSTPDATCECSSISDYCGGRCQAGGCTPVSPGCGFLYQYTCNGHCV